MNKQKLVLVGTIFLSIALGYLLPNDKSAKVADAHEKIDTSSALIHQEIDTVAQKPVEITQIYKENQLIAIVHDESAFQSMLDDVYEKEYKADFPNSKLGFVDDIYQVKTMSTNTYEDKDQEIFNYIHSENLFAIEANKVELSNGAIIYVQHIEDFNRARETFVRNFVSTDEVYELLKSDKPLAAMVDYGEREIKLEVKETLKIAPGFASPDKILKNESDILMFLSYGYEPSIETYEVQRFDTVDGIGWNHGLTGYQLIAVNRDTLKSRDQLLDPGTMLNVSKFSSPLTVQVTKERKVQEIIYPDEPIYMEDPELKEGIEVVDVVERAGTRDVTYHDISINTESVVSSEVSSRVTNEPVRSVIRLGTKVEPKIGSGRFRMPISNGFITCHYGNSCYYGHNGTDFVYYGNGGLGPIYASDRGVVKERRYRYDWGNYVLIDHGNGYMTRYAHMSSPGYVVEGETVAAGQEIGYIGGTGNVTGPHLHFEIYLSGIRINPCSLLGC